MIDSDILRVPDMDGIPSGVAVGAYKGDAQVTNDNVADILNREANADQRGRGAYAYDAGIRADVDIGVARDRAANRKVGGPTFLPGQGEQARRNEVGQDR
ncbi:hypothetical protein KTAU_29910 [Thermogemmatispora aurantia]|nr:hypothetical protein KTAU_29910 [Thermogemmatispora aurantia]